jgi:serine/threonine-protein kinase
MSPEQCRGVSIDHRADLYSLGVIVFRLIAGRAPFVGEGEGDVLAAHIHVPPPTLSSLVPDVPPSIERLVAALLQKAPGDRPQTAEQVIAMIDAAQAHSSTGPELTRTPSPPPHMLAQPSSTLTTLSSAATPAPTNGARPAIRRNMITPSE